MKGNYVAIDIGASSGRLLLADCSRGQLDLQEIHRFKNGFSRQEGHDRWNISHLLEEILLGLEKVKARGIDSCILGIDTWAVDYALLDEQGQLLAQPVAYRDRRTQGVKEALFKKLPREVIYEKTGIQFQDFNTLYQYASETLLDQATQSLMIPDYLAYCLTGRLVGEETNVSTSQLLNLSSRDYDSDLLDLAGISRDQLPDLVAAGTVLGPLKADLRRAYNLPDCTVVAVATHDTASAVVGVPATSQHWAYLSSGTWSLIGVESQQPLVSSETLAANYTNEWGAYGTYRFLKNITGMWTIQEIARMQNYQYSYAEMAAAASQEAPFQQYVNLNDERFNNPENMIEEIQAYCRETKQPVPETVGQLTMCVYSNLALIYAYEWQRLERLTGESLETLQIVGGGSNVALLNQLTADLIGKPVVAGPGEATAIGNLLVQMISQGDFADLSQARQWLAKQLPLKTYQPQTCDYQVHLQTFANYLD